MSKNSVHVTSKTEQDGVVVAVDLFSHTDGSLVRPTLIFLSFLHDEEERVVVVTPKQARKVARALRRAARRVEQLSR